MRIHAFDALRPVEALAGKMAAPPYDTLDSEEARARAAGNGMSFLHINRPEIDLPVGTDLYTDAVYEKARENLALFRARGWLKREGRRLMYLYRQTMGEHQQTGLVCCCHIDDYMGDVIRKHELTRKDKEDDRTRHTASLGANIGPVFLAYRDVGAIDALLAGAVVGDGMYDFSDELGVRHQVWPVEETAAVERLFREAVPRAYIADGHHRSASAVRVGRERRAADPGHTGEEEYNWFLSVLFPASQLKILAYNRVVKDLNGRSAENFLQAVGGAFRVERGAASRPAGPRGISMYLGGEWYGLSWAEDPGADPVARLDVSQLQGRLLGPILGIDDPRTDERIRFIGGIRGSGELKRLVDGGEAAVGFSMYPTTMEQLMAIADAGQIMPPKSTWFEPKLRTGLLTHVLE